MAARKKLSVEVSWPEGVPLPPAGLESGGVGERLWVSMHKLYEINDEVCPEKLLLLRELVYTADMSERLRVVVEEAESLRARGSRNNDVEIPELGSLRNSRAQMIALVKAMCLPEDEDSVFGPMSRSQVARKAARARWGV